MKTILQFVLFIVFIASAFTSNAQSWAAPGAVWYYDYWPDASPVAGYCKMVHTKDTLIEGKICSVLNEHLYAYDYLKKEYDSGYCATCNEYIFATPDTVYQYHRGQFYVLYNFNAKVGEKWTIAGGDMIHCSDSVGKVRVDSIGTIVINGTLLRWIAVSPTDSSQYGFLGYQNKIIEKIGNTWYMLPVPNCVVDGTTVRELRCYDDDNHWYYHVSGTPACNYISNVGVSKMNNFTGDEILIHPNPATNKLFVNISGAIKVESAMLIDITGRELLKRTLQVGENEILLDEELCGIYFLKVIDKQNQVLAVKKVLLE